MDYDMLFPQLDTLEIQSDKIMLNPDQRESSLLISSQAEPMQSSSFSIDSMELGPPEIPVGEVIPSI